ncbi:MAG TPA: response regulator transcription factor [Rectinemataceae bacterium]|nr:response regulator transcription factor [Rectinemataceae bacterium]
MLRILVADDHFLIRKGLRQLIEESLPVSRLDEAEDGVSTMAQARANRYDVVILDISMPGKDGLDLIRDIKEADPEAKVLVLSISPEEQYALRAFKLGASGCLNKSGDPGELVDAIRTVVGGRRYLSPKTQELLLEDSVGAGDRPPHELLSDREYQVFRLLASGKPIGEIAALLSLSVKTVSTYRARVLGKMGMENNAQLTHYAFKNGLVGGP